MELNYINIVLEGYYYHQEHLDLYFFRKWNEAKEQYYSKTEFFDGCLRVTNTVEQDINRYIHDEKRELYDAIAAVRSGRIEKDPMGLTDEEVIHELKSRLEQLENKEGYSGMLWDSTGRNYQATLFFSEIQYIREKLKEARAMDEPQKSDTHLRLKKILESNQAQVLYKKLINGDFIPRETPVENFNYWFGVSNKPSDVTPLVWNKSKALLAYFVDVANDHYKLKHGENRIIKPFELMFDQKGLTGAISDYKKTGALPVGHDGIEALF